MHFSRKCWRPTEPRACLLLVWIKPCLDDKLANVRQIFRMSVNLYFVVFPEPTWRKHPVEALEKVMWS